MDALGVAVLGLPLASGARLFVGDGVVFGDGEGGAFAVTGVAVALGVDDMDGGGSAGVATLEAEGGDLVRSQQMVAVWPRTRHSRRTP